MSTHAGVLGAGEREERALLLRAGAGDAQAMRALHRRLERRLYGFGLGVLAGEGALAEEMAIEASARVWRAAPRFDPAHDSVRAFVFACARRAAGELWRRRAAAAPLVPRREDADGAVEEPLQALMAAVTVREALDTLPEQQRALLELSYRDDLQPSLVGAQLGLDPATVWARTYAALRALRRALHDRGVGVGDVAGGPGAGVGERPGAAPRGLRRERRRTTEPPGSEELDAFASLAVLVRRAVGAYDVPPYLEARAFERLALTQQAPRPQHVAVARDHGRPHGLRRLAAALARHRTRS